MPAGIAGELARVRGFVRRSSPLFLLFLAMGLYLGYPRFGMAFWILLVVLGMFAAVDVYVLRRLAQTSRLIASGAIGETEARRTAAALAHLLFALAGVLGAVAVLLLVVALYA